MTWLVLRAYILFSLLVGVAYPLVVWLYGQVFFPHQANGSLIEDSGRIYGSELIGQAFQGEGYFWPRPSNCNYQPLADCPLNLGVHSQALGDQVEKRKRQGLQGDALFHSASGLDPDLSPAAVLAQVPRVAAARNMNAELLSQVVQEQVLPRQWGILGEPRVNILKLNLLLDKLQPMKTTTNH